MKVVRAVSEPHLAAEQRRGSRDRRRSTSSSDDGGGLGGLGGLADPPSIAVDYEALAREAPCLVVAPDLACTGTANAHVLTEVGSCPLRWAPAHCLLLSYWSRLPGWLPSQLRTSISADCITRSFILQCLVA